ncbi:hypothetical protein GCM10010168_62640 [Actinoplanes ianthinogenes]|uniref:PAC domain-containing protein n=1 Tax=Actinoplanes ianthinogenes TaxID=122358 RepID=A0ABM7LJR3_9ACTN|nr:PAS domain-containing protein [Actinoplanes ianthinogenes]BCJ39488.1 hypothetical protein Aiant_01450 [Actinoplanes ianthinogenes]GGR35740.1 hypothetical protein GCM10010168_62640 [Actinoplanes ianthinogenes]
MGRPDPGRSRVVLIGTSRFDDPRLPDHPVIQNNVIDLGALLTDPVDGLVPARNCTALLDEADISRLGGRVKSAADAAEDLLLIYYSGHGCLDPRRHDLFLAVPGTDPANLGFTAINVAVLNEVIRTSGAANKVLILDCCYSGRAETGWLGDQESVVRGTIDVAGRFTLTSATGNQTSVVLPGENHTAFTGRLLDVLRDGIPHGPAELSLEVIHRRLVTVMAAENLPRPEQFSHGTAAQLVLAVNRAVTGVPENLEPALRPPWSEEPENFFDDAPCGYLTLLPDWTIVEVNGTFLTWTGFRRDELVGYRTFTDLLSAGGRIFVETHSAPLLSMQGHLREIAYTMVRADGSNVPVLVNMALVREKSGTPRLIRCVIFEATERLAYERELLAARRAAEQELRELKERHLRED